MKARFVFPVADLRFEGLRGGPYSWMAASQLKAYLESVDSLRDRLEVDVVPFLPAEFVRVYIMDRNQEHLLRKILSGEPIAVGFSLYVWNIACARRLAQALRSIRPDLPLIAGGPEVSDREQFVLDCPEFDIAVEGEGEAPLRDILDRYLSGSRDLSGIPSISYRTPSGFVHAPFESRFIEPRSVRADLPVQEQYPNHTAYFALTRGCSFRCSYCLWSRPAGTNNPHNMILDELRIALAQGIRRLFFSDSDLSEILEFSPKLYDEIVALLAEHPEARSLIFANVRHVDDPLLPRIVSDFRAQRVHLGVQSLQPKVLRAVGRSWAIPFLPNIENIPSVVRERLVVELIYPLPEETLESFMNGIQRLLDMGIYGFTIYPLSALRGTQLRKQIRDDPGYSFLESAPYHVFKTPSFSSNDWLTAAGISYVLNTLCNLANDADGAGNEVLRRILGQRPDMVRTIGSLVAEGADLPHLVTTWFSEAVGTQTEFMWDGPHPVTAVILHPHETERQAPNDSDPTPPSPPQDLPDPSDVAAWIEQAGCSALCSTVTGGGLWVSVEASFGVFDLVVTSVHMPGQAFSTVGPYNLSYSGTCKDIGVMERIVRAAQQALERDGKHSHSR